MAPEQKPDHEEEHFKPRGTVLVMVVFFFTIVALWGYVYLLMVSQGANVP